MRWLRSCLPAILFLGIVIDTTSVSARDWTIEAQPRVTPTSVFLDFELTYLGGHSVDVYESNLPWGVRYSIDLVAIPLFEGAKSLGGPLYIDDPGPKLRRVQPSEKLKGSIDLGVRFKAIRKTLQTNSVAVCFRYEYARIQSSADGVVENCVIFKAIRAQQ
jgi:hypothetical protein